MSVGASEVRFRCSALRAALVFCGAVLACCVVAAMPLPAFAEGGASDNDICGHAYLESYAGGSDMYKLVIQKDMREDAGYYRYLGPVPSCAGDPDAIYGYYGDKGPCPWNESESMRESISEVVICPGVSPTSATGWFYGCTHVSKMDLSGLDTSHAISMKCMFMDCRSLEAIDMSSLDYSSVTNVSDLFWNCSSLETVDLSNAHMPKLREMGAMFAHCTSLKEADFSGFQAPVAVGFSQLFGGCNSLERVDFSNTNLSSVVDARYAFADCPSLVSVDLSRANFGKLEVTYAMFSGCSSLASICFPHVIDGKADTYRMFENCTALETVSLPWFDYAHASRMFCNCASLTDVSFPEQTISFGVMVDIFKGCLSLDSLNLDNVATGYFASDGEGAFDSSGLREITIGALFRNAGALEGLFNLASSWKDVATGIECRSAQELLDCIAGAGNAVRFVAGADPQGVFAYEETESNTLVLCSARRTLNPDGKEMVIGFAHDGYVPWESLGPSIERVRIDSKLHPLSINGWFRGCAKLKAIEGLSNLDTSAVTDMSDLFSSCSSLENLDLSSFDTRNATTMSGMFYRCTSLSNLVLSGFDTSRVTDMSSMFQECSSLYSVDLSGFDTSRVENMTSMFHACFCLLSLDLSSFDTSNVTRMDDMFSSCINLRSLNIAGFNTSQVRDMRNMFCDCLSLSDLDVSGFNNANVVNMGCMFSGCESLEAIDVSHFWPKADHVYLGGMFSSCKALTSLDLSGLTVSLALHEDDFLAELNRNDGDDDEGLGIGVVNMDDMLSGCSSLKSVRVSAAMAVMPHMPGGMWAAKGTAAYRYDLLPGGRDATWKRVSDKVHSYALLSNGVLSISPMPFEATGEGDAVYELADTGYKAAEGVPWHGRVGDVESVVVVPGISPRSVAHWFEGCSALTSVDLSGLDTSAVGDFSSMFWGCSSLRELDLSGIDTRKATAMKRMFHGCRSLGRVRLGGNFTFRGCAWSRLAGSELPFGAWRQVDSEGLPVDALRAWASDSLPSFTAATYELVDEVPEGLTVVSVRGDAEGAKERYTVEATFERDESGDLVEVDSYELDEDYDPSVPLVIGESVSASSAKTLSSATVSKQTLKKLSGKVHSVILGPKVSKVEPEAFAAAGQLTKVTVRSKHLTSKKRVHRCMVGSRATVSIPRTWTKVITAFKKYAWSRPRA